MTGCLFKTKAVVIGFEIVENVGERLLQRFRGVVEVGREISMNFVFRVAKKRSVFPVVRNVNQIVEFGKKCWCC